ncbi:MAG: YggS family pyridoxal phosphate-dependent enzyme [Flavobacteriales bacterium]|nr:YggS family pyridoxal phosphate-dependent enzyme [Flavobacteriales bacterium]MDG1781275.1 YggS family pyridoxal phosphate-dependent enzyme [Flavobacteriales bacterium]MDG2244768.1 YggS family pyridoxal phosphate-dependent enzyme [Flavobacteriales bacterium]
MTASDDQIKTSLERIKQSLPAEVTLVAVSKTHPATAIEAAYVTGHRVFGENKVQELAEKWEKLPKDIEWHLIGHLQTNKVKYIAPFVSMIHAVDSEKLLKEINKRAKNEGRTIRVLLQLHIAEEQSKFGFSPEELMELVNSGKLEHFDHLSFSGLMGMATFTEDESQVRREFTLLKNLFDEVKVSGKFDESFAHISMGMSGDYPIAIEEGSTMIRVGSSIFGARDYT